MLEVDEDTQELTVTFLQVMVRVTGWVWVVGKSYPYMPYLHATPEQAYAGSMFDQINANSATYLPGGKVHRLYNPDPDAEADAADDDSALRRIHMNSTPATSDDMERVFGVYKFALESVPNLALTTAGGMTCYRCVFGLVVVRLGLVLVGLGLGLVGLVLGLPCTTFLLC